MAGAQLAPGSRARGILEIVERLDRVERWLAAGMAPRHVAAEARKPPPKGLGLNRWSANRYVAAALKRLHEDVQTEPIESKRARMIATLNAQVQRGLDLKRTYEQDGEIKVYDAPDLKAVNTALSLLIQVQGLDR